MREDINLILNGNSLYKDFKGGQSYLTINLNLISPIFKKQTVL